MISRRPLFVLHKTAWNLLLSKEVQDVKFLPFGAKLDIGVWSRCDRAQSCSGMLKQERPVNSSRTLRLHLLICHLKVILVSLRSLNPSAPKHSTGTSCSPWGECMTTYLLRIPLLSMRHGIHSCMKFCTERYLILSFISSSWQVSLAALQQRNCGRWKRKQTKKVQ